MQNANSFILKIQEDPAGLFQVQVGRRSKGFADEERPAYVARGECSPLVCLMEVQGHCKAK